MLKKTKSFLWGFIIIAIIIGLVAEIATFIMKILLIFGSIILFISSIIYYTSLKEKGKKEEILFAKSLIVITAIIMIGAIYYGKNMIANFQNNKNIENSTTKSTTDNSIWAKEYTSIEEFDYYIDENNIYIKEYKGNSKKVKIKSKYEINGKKHKVKKFTEGVFAVSDVDSVILPEGLTYIASNTFNSCGIKYVYIPSTLKPVDEGYNFYNYFYEVEKIYYGGTKEQWKKLTNNEKRTNIDAKEIIYNAKIEDLNY